MSGIGINDLDTAIREYNTTFAEFSYDLPGFWARRDRYGLPLNHHNLPVFSHMANFLAVDFNGRSFPWGYIYGFLMIRDKDAKAVKGVDSLIQIAAKNTSAFLPAILLLISAVIVPIGFFIFYIFRQIGLCGGQVGVVNVAFQKKTGKWIHCSMIALLSLAIMFGAIQFWTCANPLTGKIPDILEQIVKLGLQDFNKFFNYCIEELKYFLEEGLVKLLFGAIVTITKDFQVIIQNITNSLDLFELENITGTLSNVTRDLHAVKGLLVESKTEVNTINLAISGISTSYQGIKGSLRKIRGLCFPLATNPLLPSPCASIPADGDLPASPNNVAIDFDVQAVIDTIDNLDLDGMFKAYQTFNLSLINDVASKSIPLDTIATLIRERVAAVQKDIDWDQLNPVTHDLMRDIINQSHVVLQHKGFTIAGHLVRGLAIIPLIYVSVVCIGLFLGIYATHDQKFPCPDRNPTSTLGADLLNKAQVLPLLFHCYFAILCAVLIMLMSILSVLFHSIYTEDIMRRIVDRVPLDILPRNFTVDLGGSTITAIVSGEKVLRTCENNGGALHAIGIHAGHFNNLTNVLEIIEWPDLNEFKVSLEGKLNAIQESAIPKHGRTEIVQRYLDSFVLPNISFSQIQADLAKVNEINVGGDVKTLEEFANDMRTKASALRAFNIPATNNVSDQLDSIVDDVENIEANVELIQQSLGKLEGHYNSLSPLVTSIKTQVATLYDEMIALGKKLLAEARKLLNDFVVNATEMLNDAKLNLRSSIFQIINFLLNSMFRCRIFYDLYKILSEMLYLYITRYLNGTWLSLATICLWVFCSSFVWHATQYFKIIYDLSAMKMLAKKNTLRESAEAASTAKSYV